MYFAPSISNENLQCNDDEGTVRWFNEQGKFHNEHGPAIEWSDGTKYWFLNDKLHQEDGPAIEHPDGTKYWYLNGKKLTEQELFSNRKSCDCKIIEIDGTKYKLTKI